MRVLILGRTELLYDTARALSAAGHTICGVITARESPESSRTEADFAALATELGCPFLSTARLGPTELDALASWTPDIGVSLNWVNVIGPEVLAAFPRGILNAHLGDLPRYRGNAVAAWALLAGEPRVTLSVHYMAPELDRGGIMLQQPLELTATSTIGEIYAWIGATVPGLFVAALDGVERGTLEARVPDPGGFRCYPRLPADGRIDWSRSVGEIDALIRASGRPFAGAFSYTSDGGRIRRVRIWTARVESAQCDDRGAPGHIIRNDPPSGETWVLTGDGVLALREAQYEEGEPFRPGAVWRSIRMRLGLDVEAELLRLQSRIERLSGEG